MPPRIPPVDHPQTSQLDVLAKTPHGPDGEPAKLWLTLVHHPRLAKRMNVFAGVFFDGLLKPVDREMVILRVAAALGSDYEFEQHAHLGRDVGLEEGDLVALRRGIVAPHWSPGQRDLVAFADEFLATGDVGDATWRNVPYSDDLAAMLELLALIGFYRLGAGLIRASRISLDEHLTDDAG